MSAVTRATRARPQMPPGYEKVHPIKLAGAALEAGDLCYLDGTNGWKLATKTQEIAGTQLAFAAQDYAIGRGDCSMLTEGELSYGSGMTPGAPLFPGTVAGDLDDAAYTAYAVATTPAVAVLAKPRIWAIDAVSIRFSF